MTDNARIVREALELARPLLEAGIQEVNAETYGPALGLLYASFDGLDRLETELATARADLERLREANKRPRGLEFLDGATAILDRNPYPPGYAGILGPLRSYLMDLRVALAPDQKGE